jgi:hypothetical protein
MQDRLRLRPQGGRHQLAELLATVYGLAACHAPASPQLSPPTPTLPTQPVPVRQASAVIATDAPALGPLRRRHGSRPRGGCDGSF